MFDRFDGLLAQKHMVLQCHDILNHNPTIARPSDNLGGETTKHALFKEVEVHILYWMFFGYSIS